MMSLLGEGIDLSQLTVLLAVGLILGAAELARRAARDARITNRLFAEADDPVSAEAEAEESDSREESALRRWLGRAGHRAPRAEATFIAVSVGALLVAALLVWGILASGLSAAFAALFGGLPVVGPGFAAIATASPWILGIAVAALPAWLVRRDRVRRVDEIELDLPLVLELLATLAEAGLGFESAVDELLRGQPPGRPLADELRLYRLEVSTGARRAQSLRRLARRVDVPSVSSFASALAHGEETGSSIAGLLRPQASLVRQRRRERALAAAEALPEKLVVPLLIGFLPGLLVWTLGPAFFQLFEMIDAAF
jgi:pilus assembly protein TadC